MKEKNQMKLTIRKASSDDIKNIVELLGEYNLPTQDVGVSDIRFYVSKEGEELIACLGIEMFEDNALLRSVAIKRRNAHQGLGTELIKFILTESRELNIQALFLLTETAAPFFEKIGFFVVERNDVPLSIQSSTEFTELCAESATCMKISL